MGRMLALDVGDKRVGVSISDPSLTLATPLKTLIRLNNAQIIDEILSLISHYDIGALVIGLPYSLDGSMSKQTEKVLQFKDELSAKVGVAIFMQDERLSSVTADQRLREAGKKGDKLRSGMDAAAAAVILQSFLDAQHENNQSANPAHVPE